MFFPRIMRLLCLLPFFLVLNLKAQEERRVECRFLAFGTQQDAFVITSGVGGARLECQLSATQLSAPVVCASKADTFTFLNPDDSKKASSCHIPSTVRSALLVFIQVPGVPDDGTWKIFVIENTPKNFPYGGAYIANFYQKDIRFTVGEHKGMLHAGTAYGYPMPSERDTFNMAPVIFEFLAEDKWMTGNESSLRFLPGIRYLIIAYRDPISGRPRIQTYQDSQPPSSSSAAQP